MTEPTSDFCAAYGCPLLGVYGSGGKWYCCCHRDGDASRNDAITGILNQHRSLVDQSLMARRSGCPDAKLEDELIQLTRDAGTQRPSAGVIGPEYAEPHFTEGA